MVEYLIPWTTVDVITYPCLNLRSTMLVKETLFGRIKFLLAHPAVIYLLLMSWICLHLISFLKSVEIAEIPPHTGNFLNSILWPCDAIWWHTCGITLAQVMACCLTAPSDCLNQCWLISVGLCGTHLRPISQVVLQISVSNKSLISDEYTNEITATSLRGKTCSLFSWWLLTWQHREQTK